MHFVAGLIHDLGRHLDALGGVLQDVHVLLGELLSTPGQDKLDVDDMVEIRVFALDPSLAGVDGEGAGHGATRGVHLRAIADNLYNKKRRKKNIS